MFAICRPRTGRCARRKGSPWTGQPTSAATSQVAAIAKALKGADRLWLATDPDREGEAISWHVQAMLEEKKALKGVGRPAHYLQRNHQVCRAACDGQPPCARPAADRGLSRPPRTGLSWWGSPSPPCCGRKLPGSRSAGRVQSVALRLVCEREAEIEAFRVPRVLDGGRTLHHARRARRSPRASPIWTARSSTSSTSTMPRKAEAAKRCGGGGPASPSPPSSVAGSSATRSRRSPRPAFRWMPAGNSAWGRRLPCAIAQQLYEGVDIGGGDSRLDFLHADRRRADGPRGDQRRSATTWGHEYGADYLPVGAPRIQHEGEERSGSP